MGMSVLGACVLAALVVEAAMSRRHERVLRKAGAFEPPGDVYRVMQVVYPLCFAMIIGEGLWRGAAPDPVAGLVTFVAAKTLKYWAIATLGNRWTFRVLVPPGSTRTVAGPYRLMRHPNYVAVLGEIGGVALLAGARVTGPLSLLGFGALMLLRIRVEERALARTQ